MTRAQTTSPAHSPKPTPAYYSAVRTSPILLLPLLLACQGRDLAAETPGISALSDPLPGPRAEPVSPTCPGEPESFRFLYWSGHVGPGRVRRYMVEGRFGEAGLALRYDWAGDIGRRGDISRGELHWAGTFTGEDAETWRALLGSPVVPKPVRAPSRPQPTGGSIHEVHVSYADGCELFGDAREPRVWESRARALHVLAGSGLSREQQVAYHLTNDDLRVNFTGGAEPRELHVVCPSGFRSRAVVGGRHHAFIQGVPQEDCTMTLRDPDLEVPMTVRGGMRLACTIAEGGVSCRVR